VSAILAPGAVGPEEVALGPVALVFPEEEDGLPVGEAPEPLAPRNLLQAAAAVVGEVEARHPPALALGDVSGRGRRAAAPLGPVAEDPVAARRQRLAGSRTRPCWPTRPRAYPAGPAGLRLAAAAAADTVRPVIPTGPA